MTVGKILRDKGNAIISVGENASVREALKVLKDHRIGAVVVLGAKGRLAGILSERDVVRALPDQGGEILDQPVSRLMTRDVITCSPADSVNSLMAKMTEKRVRHLPVMDKGKLVGVISIGDVVKERIAETEHEAEAMKEYIAGATR